MLLTPLVNDLAQLEQPFCLVLDDYQFIRSQGVHEAVTFLLEHCPKTFPLVIATRSDPPLPLSRLRARSQTVELRAADLRFTESEAAQFLKVTHKVIIMVDVGDLREGVWPDRAVNVVREAARLPNIEVAGLGCNLACYGGVIPTTENMQMLVDIRDECRKATGLELNLLSGGNSSSLPLLLSGGMPKEINHFRIGESITLGRNVLDRTPFPDTYQDTFRVVAEIVEVEYKPSIPIGNRGQDEAGLVREAVDYVGSRDTRQHQGLCKGRRQGR